MYPCIEAIEWRDGRPMRLEYHQRRVDEAFRALFPEAKPFSLEEELAASGSMCSAETGLCAEKLPAVGLYKLRLAYDRCIRELEWQEYKIRDIRSIQLVEIHHSSMRYKSTERAFIDEAFARRGECDDILMVNEGMLTDTSYANVAFFNGQKWLSPRIPIVYGTRRAYLLDQGLIETADIVVADLRRFQRIRLFNAMIGFGEIELSVDAVLGN